MRQTVISELLCMLLYVLQRALRSDCVLFQGMEVMGRYTMDNRLQCRRMCGYQAQCTAFSYHDTSQTNCLLHAHPIAESALADGWVKDVPLPVTQSNACAPRPCTDAATVCVPGGRDPQTYKCLPLPVDCGDPEPVKTNSVLNWIGSRLGDVATMTCHPDYVVINPANATLPVLTCNSTAQWGLQLPLPDLTCQKAKFHNVTIPFSEPLPQTISDGWQACVTGTLGSPNGMHLVFSETTGSSIESLADVEFVLMFSFNAMWNQKKQGTWAADPNTRTLASPSPLKVGQPFRISLRLAAPVLTIELHDVDTYLVDLAGTAVTVDLGLVRYVSLFEGNEVDYVSFTSVCP